MQAGIGEYGCLLLGVNDGADSLDEPLRKGRASGPDSLRYTTVYNQGNARVVRIEQDPSSSRFGLPTAYELQQEHGPSLKVHWTRVIHTAEGGMVYGAPRLRRVFNRLMDLEKILAGGGESAWRLLVPAFLASTKDDYELDPDNTELQAQIDEFIHKLRNWLDVEGLDVQMFGGSIVDPSPAVKGYIAVIAAATGIPQRILMGSERGELASGQDEVNWAKQIAERQANHVNPLIKRTLNRLIYAGVLPAPTSGRMTVKWESLIELSDDELGKLGEQAARMFATIGADVAAREFAAAFVPRLNPQAVNEVQPPEALPEGPTDTETPEEEQDGELAANVHRYP